MTELQIQFKHSLIKKKQEKLRLNQETRFISDISQDLTKIISN